MHLVTFYSEILSSFVRAEGTKFGVCGSRAQRVRFFVLCESCLKRILFLNVFYAQLESKNLLLKDYLVIRTTLKPLKTGKYCSSNQE